MVFLGSRRTTNDVDILVPENDDISMLYKLLAEYSAFSNIGDRLQFQGTEVGISIDVLTKTVETVIFENLQPHLLSVHKIRIPKLDYALAMEIKCFYLRQDDENGARKRESDILDVKFLCEIVRRSVTNARKSSSLDITMY